VQNNQNLTGIIRVKVESNGNKVLTIGYEVHILQFQKPVSHFQISTSPYFSIFYGLSLSPSAILLSHTFLHFSSFFVCRRESKVNFKFFFLISFLLLFSLWIF
jgi:hypothetical protein